MLNYSVADLRDYRMGGVFLYTKELTPLVAFVGTFVVCYVSSVIIAGCKYTKFLC